MKKKNAVNKMGFTLLELLIVILIIGLLSAISIPMYKKAVEKSKVADALSTMQAVSKSEHGWYLVKNNYTKDFANLDIDLYDKDGNKAEDEILQGINYTYELLDTGILASRNNGEYTIYQDYDTKQIMCTPGTHFICDDLGAFTKEPCEKANLTWANTNSTCYVNNEARCHGLNPNVDNIWHEEINPENDWCGYTNAQNKTIYEGMKCIGTQNFSGCSNSNVNKDGICVGVGYNSCSNSIINGGTCRGENDSCDYSTLTAGGVCLGLENGSCTESFIESGGICKGSNSSCKNSTINEGGLCEANAKGGCNSSTINGGICKASAEGCQGVTINNNGQCIAEEGSGFACKSAIINEGGKCIGLSAGCYGAQINGGICEGYCESSNIYNHGKCTGNCWGSTVSDGGICAGTCNRTTINDGGICAGNCQNSTINQGGICKSSETNNCGKSNVTYSGTGCCCGDYCGSKPKCDQARCDALD